MGAMILGKVRSNGGTTIGSAWVTLTREPSGPEDRRAPLTVSRPAQPDGSFGFSGLEPGTYAICATFKGSTWLDSCEWGAPSLVTVRSEQILDGVVVTMKKGKALSIHLNDAGSHLSKHEKKDPGAHVLIGVITPNGRFRPVDLVADDGHGHDYEAWVPEGADVDLVFRSDFFDLADEAGNAVSRAGKKIRYRTPQGAAPAKLDLSVTGVNPEKISKK
jgi:hypothetical protein